jgi:hypothetical protein
MNLRHQSLKHDVANAVKSFTMAAAFGAVTITTSAANANEFKASEDGINEAAHLVSVSTTNDAINLLERMWEAGNKHCDASGELDHAEFRYAAERISELLEETSDKLGRRSPYQSCSIAAQEVAAQMLNCESRRSKQLTIKLEKLWTVDKKRCKTEIFAADPTLK